MWKQKYEQKRTSSCGWSPGNESKETVMEKSEHSPLRVTVTIPILSSDSSIVVSCVSSMSYVIPSNQSNQSKFSCLFVGNQE